MQGKVFAGTTEISLGGWSCCLLSMQRLHFMQDGWWKRADLARSAPQHSIKHISVVLSEPRAFTRPCTAVAAHMASLLNADLPSEDEEDEDFEAPEEGGRSKAAAKKRRWAPSLGNVVSPSTPPRQLDPSCFTYRRGQAPDEGEAAAGQQAAGEANELQDIPVSRAKKGKVDALWQQLQQGTAVSKPKRIGSLSSLERKSAISSSSKGKGSDVVSAHVHGGACGAAQACLARCAAKPPFPAASCHVAAMHAWCCCCSQHHCAHLMQPLG
jgi:hypothetical protein